MLLATEIPLFPWQTAHWPEIAAPAFGLGGAARADHPPQAQESIIMIRPSAITLCEETYYRPLSRALHLDVLHKDKFDSQLPSIQPLQAKLREHHSFPTAFTGCGFVARILVDANSLSILKRVCLAMCWQIGHQNYSIRSNALTAILPSYPRAHLHVNAMYRQSPACSS